MSPQTATVESGRKPEGGVLQRAAVEGLPMMMMGATVFSLVKWVGLSYVEALGAVAVAELWRAHGELEKIRQLLTEIRDGAGKAKRGGDQAA